MKAVLLCAGYGTRFESDIESDKSGKFNHLRGLPKPLLPVGSKALIIHWLDIFSLSAEISEVVLVTNEIHKERYITIVNDYLLKKPPYKISIISDGSTCNESRTGAVGCMKIGAGNFQEDLLFIAGDTLLHHSFNLNEMIGKFYSLKSTEQCLCLLISTSVSEEDVSKRGIMEVNSNGRVTNFWKSPSPRKRLRKFKVLVFT